MKHKKHKPKRKINIDIDIPLKCKICNCETKSKAGLSSHIRWNHDLTYEEYVLRYFDIDMLQLEKEYINYQLLNKEKINKEKTKGLKKYTNSIKGKSKKEILGEEKYNIFLHNMKGVFSLKWFINKYGKDIGEKKYKERSINISKISHFRKYNKENKKNWSKISQELFFEIHNIIGDNFEKIYFGELNHEYSCGVQNHNYDFVLLDKKRVLEFNGDKFHANPKLYEKNDIPLKFINKTSQKIWEDDKKKLNKAKNNGFKIKIIWESDYLNDKNKTILDCVKFLIK